MKNEEWVITSEWQLFILHSLLLIINYQFFITLYAPALVHIIILLIAASVRLWLLYLASSGRFCLFWGTSGRLHHTATLYFSSFFLSKKTSQRYFLSR